MRKNIRKTRENRFKGFTKAERKLLRRGMIEGMVFLRYSAFPVDDGSSWEDSKAYEKYVGKPSAIYERLLEELDQC